MNTGMPARENVRDKKIKEKAIKIVQNKKIKNIS